MDGLSVASSVLAIGAVGVQISIKLTAFANQVSTADDRIRSIGSDVSLTANVLQQLSELMSKSNENTAISIFSEEGLSSTSASADACERVFRELEDVLKRASNQLQGRGCQVLGKKIELSKYETLRWPFLQPNIDSLRAALRDAKETLMLILHVTTLAYMKKLAELNRPSTISPYEQPNLINAILAMHRSGLEDKDNQTSTNLLTVGSQAKQEGSTNPSSPPTGSCDGPTSRSQLETQQFPNARKQKRSVEPIIVGEGQTSEPKTARRANTRSVGGENSTKSRQNISQDLADIADAGTWLIEPALRLAENGYGYDLRWMKNSRTAEFQQPRPKLWDIFSRKKHDSEQRISELTPMERQVLDHYLSEGKTDSSTELEVKDVSFCEVHPFKNLETRPRWRRMQVLVGRKSRAFDKPVPRDEHPSIARPRLEKSSLEKPGLEKPGLEKSKIPKDRYRSHSSSATSELSLPPRKISELGPRPSEERPASRTRERQDNTISAVLSPSAQSLPSPSKWESPVFSVGSSGRSTPPERRQVGHRYFLGFEEPDEEGPARSSTGAVNLKRRSTFGMLNKPGRSRTGQYHSQRQCRSASPVVTRASKTEAETIIDGLLQRYTTVYD